MTVEGERKREPFSFRITRTESDMLTRLVFY